MTVFIVSDIVGYKKVFVSLSLCGDAGAVKRDSLKSCWLSAFEGSNPFPRTLIMAVKPGKYRHYKGKDYEVIGVAKHSETLEEFVVYKALYGKMEIWIRPLKMFEEKVIVDGVEKPRFEFIE